MTTVAALLAVGANIAGSWGEPEVTLARLPRELEALGIKVKAISPLHGTAPMGPVEQPHFTNGALQVETNLPPLGLLAVLKALERNAGRTDGVRWGPRALDIDILAYGDRTIAIPGRLTVPHPEMANRDFVLKPLADIAPGWRHPQSGLTVREMLMRLA